MPRLRSAHAFADNWAKNFQYPEHSHLLWLLQGMLGVPVNLMARHCGVTQPAMSIAIKRTSGRTSKAYRKRLDGILGEFDIAIRNRIKLLKTEEDLGQGYEVLPDNIRAATVDLLESYREYIRIVGTWSDR